MLVWKNILRKRRFILSEISSFSLLKSAVYHGEFDKSSLIRLLENRKLLNRVVRLAEINGLYYLFITNLKEMGLDLTTSERFSCESVRLEEFKRTLKLLNEVSNQNKIDHILIKSCIDVSHVPRDVDVLIHGDEKEAFIEALLERGFKSVYQTDVETALSKDGYLKIDIYIETRYLDYTFLNEPFLWNSIVKANIFDEDHWVLNNEVNLLLLMVHGIFGHRNITFLDYIQISYILPNVELATCKNYVNENGWIQTFNIIYNEFNKIKYKVDSSSPDLYFPYKFNQKFILKLINSLNKKPITIKFLFFLYISLFIDGLIYELKKYDIYNYLLKCSYIRIAFNSFNYFIRHSVGDTKSK